MSAMHTFLRFEGLLWEDMTFQRFATWETATPRLRTLEEEGDLSVELLTADGDAVVRVLQRLEFEPLAAHEPHDMRFARVFLYIGLHPNATELVARFAGQVIHREAIAAEPPALTIVGTERVGEDRVRVRWESQHANPLAYHLDYVIPGRAPIALVRNLRESEYEAELASYPGSDKAQIGVLATDGIRSAWALTDPFAVMGGSAYAWIQSPNAAFPTPVDQPLTLVGGAFDAGGRRLPDEDLVWYMDGAEVARGNGIAMATGLSPGQHEITLEHHAEIRTSVRISVVERNPEQERFAALIAQIPKEVPPPSEAGLESGH